MNNRKIFWLCVLTVIVLTASYNYGQATDEQTGPSGKIAIVSIKDVFNNSQKNADYKEKATKEQQQMLAELEKLSKEAKDLEAELKTLKSGTEDYIKLVGQAGEKRAMLEAKQKFYQNVLETKDQQWTENLYSQILDVTAKLAKEKGLDLVLEKDEVELPAAGPTELMLTIRTHKVLYAAEELDITAQVIAELDSTK